VPPVHTCRRGSQLQPTELPSHRSELPRGSLSLIDVHLGRPNSYPRKDTCCSTAPRKNPSGSAKGSRPAQLSGSPPGRRVPGRILNFHGERRTRPTTRNRYDRDTCARRRQNTDAAAQGETFYLSTWPPKKPKVNQQIWLARRPSPRVAFAAGRGTSSRRCSIPDEEDPAKADDSSSIRDCPDKVASHALLQGRGEQGSEAVGRQRVRRGKPWIPAGRSDFSVFETSRELDRGPRRPHFMPESIG